MFVVPGEYYLYSKCMKGWINARTMANSVYNITQCWNGTKFVPVRFISQTKNPTVIYKADAVTVIGCDKDLEIHSDFQWNPLSTERSEDFACSRGMHVLLAIKHFCISSHIKDSNLFCKIPRSRLRQLKPWLPREASIVSIGKRYCAITFACEILENFVCDTIDNEDHAKVYAQTALNICGSYVKSSKHIPAHVVVSDCGPRRNPCVFRKLRRTLFMCGIRNHYACNVFESKNGKNRPKRQMKLSLHNAYPHVKRKYFSLTKATETQYEDWVEVEVLEGNSIVIEGVRLTFKR